MPCHGTPHQIHTTTTAFHTLLHYILPQHITKHNHHYMHIYLPSLPTLTLPYLTLPALPYRLILYFIDSSVHISHLFPELLCDASHVVRMYMAEAIGILFLKFKSNNLSVPETPTIQDELFDIVARCLATSLAVEVSNKLWIKYE